MRKLCTKSSRKPRHPYKVKTKKLATSGNAKNKAKIFWCGYIVGWLPHLLPMICLKNVKES